MRTVAIGSTKLAQRQKEMLYSPSTAEVKADRAKIIQLLLVRR
jgi:hypothetical protein